MPDAISPSKFDLSHYLDHQRTLIHHALTKLIKTHLDDSRLSSAMGYSLMAPGKRLRPVLCLAAAEAVGKINDDVITTACAIEMIHTYSLIHDDLPAMDNDDLRRGRPTCHVQYDEATAILAGDALLTLAFEILSDPPVVNENALIRLKIIKIIANASGHHGMIEGQMRDIAAETDLISLDALKRIHQLKTGALIIASVMTGALLAGAPPASIEQLKIYAGNIGLAFQVVDDILNVEGDPDRMGKSTGTDASRNKSTYPALLGMDQSKQFAAQLVNNALHAVHIFGTKANPLCALAEYIIKRKR